MQCGKINCKHSSSSISTSAKVSSTRSFGTTTGGITFGAGGLVTGGGRTTGGSGFEEPPALFTNVGGLNGFERPEADPKGFVTAFRN